MKKKILVLLVLLGILVSPVWAGIVGSITSQGSTTAEGSHVFKFNVVSGISVTWQSATTARYLMVFDGVALPSNGATSSCLTSKATGCLAYCAFMPNSTTAPNLQTFDWTSHPVYNSFGTVIAVSTGAGCGTLTVDGTNDFIYAQLQ